jgi:hypothetical protein
MYPPPFTSGDFRGTVCLLRLKLLLCFVVLVPAGCRRKPADPPPGTTAFQSDTFSVAFYNVENLFDNEFDGNEYVEYRPNATNWNREMHGRKLSNIASAVAAVNASMIALCEVEDRDALNQLQKKLDEIGAAYRFSAIIDTLAVSNTCPALLSRFPIGRSAAHAVSFADGLTTRAILEAQVDVNGTPLTLFVNHWPSKHHPESYRLHAAKTLINRIAQLHAGADYCIVGDLNSDFDEFSTFTTFGHNDSRDSTGINHGLGTIQNIGAGQARLRTEREVIAAPFPSHYDLWCEVDEKKRMSYFYRGNRQTPDHIILPPALYDSTGISYLDNSFHAFTWEGRLLSKGRPFRWKINYQGKRKFHAGEGYSDHLPVVATFICGPFRLTTASSAEYAAGADDTVGRDGWFEFHTSGWVAYSNMTTLERDSIEPAKGRYALHLNAKAKKSNETVAATVVRPADREKDGTVQLLLRGTGTVCFRTRAAGEKWRYHRPDNNSFSGRAKYVPINFPAWRTVVLAPAAPPVAPVELELRIGKETTLDLRIDR